jgi:formylglycine-generating enzyme required for sulfatase activity
MKGIISISFILILLFCFSVGSAAQKKTEKSSTYKGMVLIPAGSFQMGSNKGEFDEKPAHTVHLSSFYMDKYEVTNGEYKKCVDAGSCRAPYESTSITRSSYYGDSRYENYPVIYVNWNQAKAYCEWKGGRLPTEAEWEYAARGGLRGMKYPNGDSISPIEANYSCSWSDTAKVGSYDPNGYGLYDMAGNVWEWTNDWYDEKYYENSPSQDPQGPSNGKYRVVRGGSWFNATYFIRVSNRVRCNAADWDYDTGFRCAR